MTPAQAAMLLGVAATFDNRKPDPAAAQAWSVALRGYGFEDCRDAIVEHYTITRDWLMPADVIRIVKNTRWSRIQAVGYVEPPRELEGDPARENAWTKALNKAAGDGLEREAAIATANQSQAIDPTPVELTVNVAAATKALGMKMRDPKARRRPEDTTPPPAVPATRED